MATAHGPLMSMEARGQVGKSLIFQNQNGKAVVKKYAEPANPNSAAQQASRANFAAVAAAWKTWIDNGKQTWDAAINSKYLTAKAAFFGINLLRLERGIHIATYYTGTAAVDTMDQSIATDEGGTLDPNGLYRRSATYNGYPVYERISDSGMLLWRAAAGYTWYITRNLGDISGDFWAKYGATSPGGEYEWDEDGTIHYCEVSTIFP